MKSFLPLHVQILREKLVRSTTGIPETGIIISEAIKNIESIHPNKLQPTYIKKNFSEMCEMIFYETYAIYQKHENNSLANLGDSFLRKFYKKNFSEDDFKKMINEVIVESTTFEKSLKQSRASRAGKAFEIIVMRLLDEIGIPNEHITKEDKKSGLRPIDIVVPDRKTAVHDSFKAHYLSLKTSLKDRWKLVVEDQRQGQRTYLLTLLQREKISKEVADKIVKAGILLFIPDQIKLQQFQNKQGVCKLSDLPKSLK